MDLGGHSHHDAISLSPNPTTSTEDTLRKGLSVPDLEAVALPSSSSSMAPAAATAAAAGRSGRQSNRSDSPVSSLDEDEVDAFSPRSCPSSPRKHSVGQIRGQMDSISLEPNSPHR